MNNLTVNSGEFISYSFGLQNEANIPTWYSSFLLNAVSFISFFIFFFEKKRSIHYYFWLLFAAVYCFLSFDEVARIHEATGTFLSIKWVYLYAPFAFIFFILCAFYLIKIRKSEKTLRNWILGGLIIFAIGGMGFEALDYYYYPLPDKIQKFEYMIEEGLEMTGTIIVLTGCLNELINVQRKQNTQFK